MGKRWYGFFAHGRGDDVNYFLIALGFVIVSQLCWAGDEALRTFDWIGGGAETSQVGDAIHLTIQSADVENFHDSRIEAGSDVNLHDQGWDLLEGKGAEVVVVPLKPGQLTLPPLEIKDAQGKILGRTQSWSLSVQTAIPQGDPQPTQPNTLEPPVGVGFPIWVVIFLGLGVVVLLVLLGYAVWKLIQKRKLRAVKVIAAPRLSADEQALQEFQELAQLQLYEKGEWKLFYFRVSEILKKYIGERYHIEALESTTREMMESLEVRRALSDANRHSLESIFSKLDLVKFTDFIPELSEATQLIPVAKEWVLNTRLHPVKVE